MRLARGFESSSPYIIIATVWFLMHRLNGVFLHRLQLQFQINHTPASLLFSAVLILNVNYLAFQSLRLVMQARKYIVRVGAIIRNLDVLVLAEDLLLCYVVVLVNDIWSILTSLCAHCSVTTEKCLEFNRRIFYGL